MTNNCLDHGFDGLKDFTDCKNKSHQKIREIPQSVTIRDSDNVQQEMDKYLKELLK